MNLSNEINTFIDDYVNSLREGNAAIFAGAGLSIPTGMVDWKGLLRKPASQIGLNVDIESDLVSIAQYIYNRTNTKTELANLIIKHFEDKGKVTSSHNIIANLPIRTFWTTNYDNLLERSLRIAGKNPDVKKRVQDLSIIRPKSDAVIYKMHGDANLAYETIITKNDYETYEHKNQLFTIALKGDLVSKKFLFVGFSFEDPNLTHILSKIKILVEDHAQTHYCFFRKILREDFSNDSVGEKQFEYERIKQELKCIDLKRYSIHPLLVDSYEDIPKILNKIKEKLNHGNVFISGSAEHTNEYIPNNLSPTEFLHLLSQEISRCGFKITSGFGTFVGSAIINGVLSNMKDIGTKNMNEYLNIRPFPQFSTDSRELVDLWEEYRSQMLEENGIAIFVFGNKISEDSDTGFILADGVEAEFNMAVQSNKKVIPIGATGYVSLLLWKEVITNFDHYYPDNPELKKYFLQLGNEQSDAHKIIESTIKILQSIKEE